MFILGTKSLGLLAKAHPDLQKVVRRGIQLTAVDFSVGESVRTLARQRQLVAAGASQTLNSRHLAGKDGLSRAVDLHAYVGGKVAWDWPLYFRIAAAVRLAAIELKIPVRWGGTWSELNSIRTPLESAQAAYVAARRRAGRKAFIDGPHFELPTSRYP